MYSDEQQVMELKKGNELAVEALLAHYGNRLLRTAYGICGDLQVAEEVVQDTMLQVCRKIHGFESRATLATWMFRITINLAKNRVRGSWLHRLAVWDEGRMHAIPAPMKMQPETSALREEQRSEVLCCLQSLSVKYREVLVLYYLEEFSVQEISRILEQPEGTIRSKMSRGRTLLKEKLRIQGVTL